MDVNVSGRFGDGAMTVVRQMNNQENVTAD
jgi:hypothetical protein